MTRWFLSFFLSIFGLGAISLLVIYSQNKALAQNQLIYWVLGSLILATVQSLHYAIFQKYTSHLYIFSLMGLLLLFFVADPIRGSTRWIDFGLFRFQPSEIAKVGLILVLARFFSQRSAKDIKNVISSLIITAPLFALTLVQPDIGNASVFLAIWLGVTIAAGFKIKHLIILVMITAIVGFLSFEILAPYQRERVETFINPDKDPLGTGYNIIQAKIAIGSGQFFGRGLGRGSQSQLNFLPESESDFIFASIAEQLGFVGAAAVIVLFSILLINIIQITKNKDDRFAQVLIAGFLSFMLAQFIVNVGMNMSLLPVTGITLPLVSYGGSSLLSTLLILGIVLSVKRSIRY